jgi:hypothetical protein
MFALMSYFRWVAFPILAGTCAAVILFAPSLGLGDKYDFVLYRLIGMPRASALSLLLWALILFFIYRLSVAHAKVKAIVIVVTFSFLVMLLRIVFWSRMPTRQASGAEKIWPFIERLVFPVSRRSCGCPSTSLAR